MPINASAILNRLQDQAARDQSFLEASYEGFGDIAVERDESDAQSPNPIMDKFLRDVGPSGFQTLTNFTVSEFEALWGIVDDALNTAWSEGRGRRSPTTPKDSLFMVLVVLKHYCTWDKHAADFGYKAPTFEKLMMRVISAIEPVLVERFVKCPTMGGLSADDQRFENFPYALYAVDVKFQPALRPSGRFLEQKRYFSGKHSLYGYKIEAAVSPAGLCVAMSDAHPGSVHDLTIMHSRRQLHEANLKKSADEMLLPDHGELAVAFRSSWACLVDMGYTGISHSLRGIHPKRRPANGSLDADDVERNRLVASDRIVVENFFGRVCTLWKVSHATFKWSEKNFLTIQRTAFALTNFHLTLMPLRSEDAQFYRRDLSKYERLASEKTHKRAESQRRYRLSRQERANVDTDRAARFLSSFRSSY